MPDSGLRYAFTVRLHDTDAAGRLFFGHLFRYAQEAFESFMDQIGWPVPDLIRSGEILLPVVRAEADYRRPIQHGDRIHVEVWVEGIRRRSFAICYRFLGEQGEELAQAKTVHVLVSTGQGPVTELPEGLRQALADRLQSGQ